MRAAMSTFLKSANNSTSSSEEDVELRRGPWTHEEDNLLIHYIACHGEGRWNLLAKRSGLRRTGKSCRLRWLNYLKPDVKRGNLTPQEQLLILQLHSKWGNRWSKIAQHLPGRTDNEIKNYWRTRVQKQARNLKIETNSTVFQDVLRCFWIPRLLQKIERTSSSSSSSPLAISSQNSTIPQPANHATQQLPPRPPPPLPPQVPEFGTSIMNETILYCSPGHEKSSIISSENCTSPSIFSSRSMTMTTSQVSEYPTSPFHAFVNNDYSTSIKGCYYLDNGCHDMGSFNLTSMSAEPINECHVDESNWVDNGLMESLWNMDELVAI